MLDIDNAINELDSIVEDACSGKLTEAACRKRIEEYKLRHGTGLITNNSLGELKDAPASKEKLRKLRIIRAEGGTSEETFVEMARTGRALKQKETMRTVAIIAAIIGAIAIITAVATAVRK